MTLVLLLIPTSGSFLMLLADSCLMGAFVGVFYPQTLGYISKRTPSANLGFAMGLCEATFGIGFFVGPIAFGFLAEVIGLARTCLILGGAALSIIPLLLISRPNRLAGPFARWES
jgi:DHA1 family multidrug resistance protein-like MFS transporter/DHA1 family quinolone resistance protein-like MFS transporter